MRFESEERRAAKIIYAYTITTREHTHTHRDILYYFNKNIYTIIYTWYTHKKASRAFSLSLLFPLLEFLTSTNKDAHEEVSERERVCGVCACARVREKQRRV